MLVALLMALLLCRCCSLRSRGLWLVWGLTSRGHASIAVLFGLPTDRRDRLWLDGRCARHRALYERTGSATGRAAALFTIGLILGAAIPVLVRATGDFAWKYTHPPLIPGGYDVTIAPPAAQLPSKRLLIAPVSPGKFAGSDTNRSWSNVLKTRMHPNRSGRRLRQTTFRASYKRFSAGTKVTIINMLYRRG